MSKYNVGDKFIIEISKNNTNELDSTEYYITNGSRVYEKEELDRLQKYNEVKERLGLIDELKMDEYNKGLNEGRNEVWELTKKLWYLGTYKCKEIFGYEFTIDIIEHFTPQEALAKLEAYEKQNEIKVGDVVEQDEHKFVIIFVNNEFVNGIDENGRFSHISIENCKKTGKHIDIQSLLEQIRK